MFNTFFNIVDEFIQFDIVIVLFLLELQQLNSQKKTSPLAELLFISKCGKKRLS